MSHLTKILTAIEQRGGRILIEDGRVIAIYPRERDEELIPLIAQLPERSKAIEKFLARRNSELCGERRARVIGQSRITASASSEVCWHCKGSGRCNCALDGVAGPRGSWHAGMCGACLGTGYLTWPPETIQ